MTDISDAADLLEIARATLLDDLVPALPNERRYAGLMIANAMAIAARERRLGASAERDEAGRLRRLVDGLGQSPRAASGVDARGELPALRTTVCDAIRAGAFDDPRREAALAAQLLQIAAAHVAISNPKILRGEH